MIYNEIYNFCKVRDNDRIKYSNRAKFIVELLNRYHIEHKVVRTKSSQFNKYFYNIYCFGSSDKFLSAHYDVVNIHSDNANDNSASVINCIAYKLKNPSINLLILDGEEPPYMGMGSEAASKYLKKHNIPVKWIFNLELTGIGKSFFIDEVDTILSRGIIKQFPDVFITPTPPNDAMIFRRNGFASNVTTVVDEIEVRNPQGEMMVVPNMEPLFISHTVKDSVNNMSIEDMQNFVDNVVDVIVKNC